MNNLQAIKLNRARKDVGDTEIYTLGGYPYRKRFTK